MGRKPVAKLKKIELFIEIEYKKKPYSVFLPFKSIEALTNKTVQAEIMKQIGEFGIEIEGEGQVPAYSSDRKHK